jgi:hypothetical protein
MQVICMLLGIYRELGTVALFDKSIVLPYKRLDVGVFRVVVAFNHSYFA